MIPDSGVAGTTDVAQASTSTALEELVTSATTLVSLLDHVSLCHRIGIIDRRRGPASLGLPEGVKESVVKVGIVHGSLPSFRSCYSGKILCATITL